MTSRSFTDLSGALGQLIRPDILALMRQDAFMDELGNIRKQARRRKSQVSRFGAEIDERVQAFFARPIEGDDRIYG